METHGHNTSGDALLAAVFLLIDILAIVGNTLFLLCLLRLPSMNTKDSNLLLVLLAVTDLTCAVLVMSPTIVATVVGRWVFGSALCTLQCTLNYSLIITSMLTLAVISCDRMIAVTRPLKYTVIVTRPRVQIAMALSCLQGVSFGLAPGIRSWVVYDHSEKVCAIDWENGGIAGVQYVTFAFVFCFLIPAVIIVVNFVIIVVDLKSKHCKLNRTMRTQETKAIQSLFVVVVFFLVCLAPFSVTKLIKIFNMSSVPSFLNNIATVLHFMASASNPLVYGIFRKDFRKGFRQVLGLNFDVHAARVFVVTTQLDSTGDQDNNINTRNQNDMPTDDLKAHRSPQSRLVRTTTGDCNIPTNNARDQHNYAWN